MINTIRKLIIPLQNPNSNLLWSVKYFNYKSLQVPIVLFADDWCRYNICRYFGSVRDGIAVEAANRTTRVEHHSRHTLRTSR